MPGRRFSEENQYRYGFNGKENDNEVKGEANQQDYGMRIYDPRIGKFLSVDPLESNYPWFSPYHFAGNTPIQAIDLDGLEEIHYIFIWVKGTDGKEAVLKLTGWQEGKHTGELDENGVMKFDRPYKITAHYPREILGTMRFVSAEYDSEEAFRNAKSEDFRNSAINLGMEVGTEVAMMFGDLMAMGYITSKLTMIGREIVSLYVEQKIAQYSSNMVNKDVLNNIINENIRQQILKSTTLTAETKLAATEATTQGSHFYSRHGAQTTIQQQLQRATTGLTPDGLQGKPVSATRFLSHDFELEALEKALAAYKPEMKGKGTVIDMGKIIGEGYFKGGGNVQQSTKVQVYYNNSGDIITMFPKID